MSSNSNKSDRKTNNTNENSKVNTNNETSNEWLEPVTDEEYNNL